MVLSIDESTHIPFEFSTVKRTARRAYRLEDFFNAADDCYFVESPQADIPIPPPDETFGVDANTVFEGGPYTYDNLILKTRDRLIAKLHNVEVDKAANFHFLDRNIALADIYHPSVIRTHWNPHIIRADIPGIKVDLLARKKPESIRTIKEDVVSLGFFWINNYWHLLMDVLPRLRVLSSYPQFNSMPILWHAHQSRFIEPVLEAFGIKDRLVTVDTDAVICERLYLPSMFAPDGMSREQIDWVRDAMMRAFGVTARPDPKRLLYVSRREAAARKIGNEAELFRELQALGFEMVVPAEMSMAEQIATFSEARMFVGPHGASFANLIYCPDNIGVVDIQPGNRPHPFTFAMAKLKRQYYGTYLCQAFDDVHMAVDVRELVSMVERLMAKVDGAHGKAGGDASES